MRRRTTVFALAVALMALAAVAVPGAASLNDSTATEAGGVTDSVVADNHIEECAAEPPADYADPDGGNEVLGWVDGIWYNEPLAIDTSDGLNDTELEHLSARTTARVEAIRCLAAVDGTPPVQIQTREEFQANQTGTYANVSEKNRLADNARFETTLMISSEEDSISVREANRGTTVGGFYSPTENRIVVVTDDPENFLIEEQVLAQEVGHAIQDQQFNLTRLVGETTDEDLGYEGLVEGDMNLVDQRYQQACNEGLWNEPCVSESNENGGGSGSGPANWGLYLQSFQPYSEGPPFIQSIYEAEGWDAIDAMYDNPPDSALYTVFPETYEEVDLADVEVADQSSDGWERLTWEDELDYDTLGPSNIAAMFMATTYDSQQPIIDPQSFLNTTAGGEVSNTQPLIYGHPQTEGWRDDKLYTYQNGNQTGTVWKVEWASAEDAKPFIESYGQLAGIRGGEAVDGYEHTYRFGENSDWDMALTLVPDGSTVTVVTAPTVEDLTAVHDIDLVESQESTPTATPTETSTATPTETSTDSSESGDDTAEPTPTETPMSEDTPTATETPEDSDGDGAGFGVLAGVLAVTMTALIVRRRR
ncbi:hypothetical protein SAMN05216226_101307 [Halovenus aranensis]|uniref:PGF-CTERM protein n=1 Tax=Halovenus aranensis TaxID=890420 RepID=A0A1G8S698_9EURY|nr:Hvo_1808 family surface protein [Halovenus aranensis]SDJ24717.1 hypothetical protein SAMN05216226_101307 [Halovenus aranensis]